MRYAVGLPTVGEFGEVNTLVDLAVAAERHGWDGVHLWDHLLYHEPDWPVISSTVTAAAIAARTAHLRIILTVALPRRQAQDVAQDLAAIGALSGGRLIIVATIGSMEREYTEFGLDPRRRGRALDEGLALMTRLWSQWRVPPIPIWCGGRWPNTVGLRRAARWDGVMPTFADQRIRNVPVEDFAAAVSFVDSCASRPLDIALEGAAADHEQIAGYIAAGMTWWIEAMGWWRGGVPAAMTRITAGPPRRRG